MVKTLDKIFPRWVFYILLAVAVFYANYFTNTSIVYNTLKMFVASFSASNIIILNIFVAIIEVGFFELISRIYYNYVSRNTGFKGLTCTKMQFVDTLRVFFIFKCICVGTAFISVYFFPYLIPIAVNTFNLFFSVVFYSLFFFYIKNKFINKEIGGKTFLYLAVPFLVYSVLVLLLNLL